MAYSAKASKDGNGGYDLRYGKGSKQLTSSLTRDGSTWIVRGTAYASKSTAVAAWEKWAASAYGGTDPDSDTPTNDPPAEATDAPTDSPDIGVNDELSEYDRSLLKDIYLHQGPITEWQRSMLRNLLKRLTSAFEPKVYSKCSKPFTQGPPKFIVKDTEYAPTELPAAYAEPDTGLCSPDMGSEVSHSGEESGLDGAGAGGGIVDESEVAS